MRLIVPASIVFLFTLASAIGGPVGTAAQGNSAFLRAHDPRGVGAGRSIFRFDTLGDEQLWTNVLRMHEALRSVDPATALAVGLKVDIDALPK